LSRSEISADEFGEMLHPSGDRALPAIRADEHGLVIQPRGAIVHKGGQLQAADAEVHVARGEHVTIGAARLSVSGVVQPRVRVRNVFGMESVEAVTIVVPKVAPRVTAEVAAVHGSVP
jgi:hypothetical protein